MSRPRSERDGRDPDEQAVIVRMISNITTSFIPVWCPRSSRANADRPEGFERRDRHHSAVAGFAAQPSQEHPHQHGGVEPIRLGPFVLARDRTLLEWMTWAPIPCPVSHRASQKPSRPASKATAMRVMVRPFRTASSRQRCSTRSSSVSSGYDLLQWLAFDPWNGPGNQPARLTELDHSNQGGGVLERDE
jgi:hypothetical protein